MPAEICFDSLDFVSIIQRYEALLRDLFFMSALNTAGMNAFGAYTIIKKELP